MQLDMAQVYTDFSGLAAMRARAREDQEAALDQVARQFESLFLQMMLKSMRDASAGDGLMDSKQSEFYREMYDKQIAMDLSERQGIGLAAVIKRQLGGSVPAGHRGNTLEDYLGMPIVAMPTGGAAGADAASPAAGAGTIRLDGSPERFLGRLWPAAREAAGRLDLAPEVLLAQAALETGWGRHVIRHRDGDSSHNLFGIKADARWRGDRVNVDTLEYRDGVALKTRADFRAYGSFAESFADYVDFVQQNPRYRKAVHRTDDPAAYFTALQAAGYATDPDYANKVMRILDSAQMRSAKQIVKEDAAAL